MVGKRAVGILLECFLFVLIFLYHYLSRFVSAGDARGQEHPATPMSSYYAGHSGCEVT